MITRTCRVVLLLKKPAEINTEEAASVGTYNQGNLILDTTCTPADMRFPTDLGLSNEAREKLDGISDTLYSAMEKNKKTRTYREKARKDYVMMSKQKSPKKNPLRKTKSGAWLANPSLFFNEFPL